MSKPLIYLDTETTGLGNCRMVELSYLAEGESLTFRVKPPISIEAGASMVNHITDEMVADLIPFSEMPLYAANKVIIEDSIVVAHNASFDIGVLNREGIFPTEYIDTKEMAKAIYPEAPMHRLQFLRYYLKLAVEGDAHTAEGDVAVLKALWDHMALQGMEEVTIAQWKRSV